MPDVTKDEIIDRLEDKLEDLVFALWPGAAYGPGKALIWPEPSANGSSFQVFLRHRGKKRRGQWNRYSARVGGGPLELIMYAQGGVVSGRTQWFDALKWAKGWLGLGAPETATERAARLRRAEASRRQAEAAALKEAERAARHANEIVAGTVDVTTGDPVWTYLTGARGLPLVTCPPVIRLHPALKYFGGRDWVGPAMVARVAGRSGWMGCHMTYLKLDGSGKAPLRPPKLMRGAVAGGIVVISNGHSDRRLAELARDGLSAPVVLAEGIETGLAIACAMPDLRVWACLSLGNMAVAPVDHAAISTVLLAIENDVKPQAIATRDAVIAALEATGKPVIPVRSPQGSDFADLF